VAPSPRLLTASEVADLFRVTEATVASWRRGGRLTAIRLPGGKGYRYDKAEVEALLVSERATPEPEQVA